MQNYNFVIENESEFNLWDNPLSSMNCTSIKDAGVWAKSILFVSKNSPSILFKKAGRSKKIYRCMRDGTIAQVMANEQVFVKCSSHRARERLFRLTGKIQAYYNSSKLFNDNSKGYYLIGSNLVDEVLKIKGISRCKNQDSNNYSKCW